MTDFSWLNRYFDESNSPNDRTVIVLSMAFIEESLTDLLKLHLKPALEKRTEEDALFGFSRPVSNIAAKIDLAYRLGILDKKLTKTLKKLARIRNIAAHRSDDFSITSGKIKDQMKSIIDSSPKQGADHTMPKIWLNTFTATLVETIKSVTDNMRNKNADDSLIRSAVVQVCDDQIFGRNYATKKHGMSIWHDE